MGKEINLQKKNTFIYNLLFLIICSFFCYVILFVPIPRQIGLTFRNTLYVFPLIFIVILLYCCIQQPLFQLVLKVLLFCFLILPYSGMLNSGISDQYALGGFVPWSDAFTMQLNTQRFLYGGQMGQSTAIRPLATVFYAVFLRIFGNNYLALYITIIIITALCLIVLTEAVNKTFGPFVSAFLFTILYYYIRQRFGTFMTEPFGFICGLLCCYWFFTGIYENKQIKMLLGFLLLSIGLNARPAAMFMLPAVGLWYFFVFLRNNKKRILWAGAALFLMLSGFMMNSIAQKAVYGTDKIPNRQAAEMIYGLCLGGKSWGDVVGTEEMTALNSSENIIKDVADLCVPVLKEHPENIISALRTIFIDSLIQSEYYGAFSFVNGNPRMLQTFIRYLLMILWTAGVIILITKRKTPVYSFLLVSAIGIIISECAAVPFSTNYLRLYAVSMWVPACICGIFPQSLAYKIKCEQVVQFEPRHMNIIYSYVISASIIFIAIFGAGIIKNHPFERPSADTELCDSDDDVLLTSIDYGSFIYLAEQPDLKTEHYPYFRLPFVRQHFHDTASVEMFPFTDSIDTPTAVIRGIDLQTLEDALVFAPLEMIEGKTGNVQFCGRFLDPPVLRNDRFFIPTAVFFEGDL